MSVPVPWVEVGADAICGHVRSRATTARIVYCPDCERTAFKVLRAALPLIDAMGASGIRAERQVVADLRAKVEVLRQAAWDAYAESSGTGIRYGTMASTLTSVLALIDGDSDD